MSTSKNTTFDGNKNGHSSSRTRSRALWTLQVGLLLGTVGYILQLMMQDGMLAREENAWKFSGIHWYAIVIFLFMFLGYMVLDRKSILWIPLIGLVYYTLHEGLFNAFFLSYNQFMIPPTANIGWYIEIALSVIVPVVVLSLCLVKRSYRERILRRHKWPMITVWTSFLTLNVAWMLSGFPVTDNLFVSYNYTVLNYDFTANSFEVAYNVLFSIAFFVTFNFSLSRKGFSSVESIDDRPLLVPEATAGQRQRRRAFTRKRARTTRSSPR